MSLPESTTVLIVGAGPAGLAAALSLIHQACRDFVIVDATLEGQNTSRAVTIHAATIEALTSIGAADGLVSRAMEGKGIRVTSRTSDSEIIKARFDPLKKHTAHPSLFCPQNVTEFVLGQRLQSLGVQVQRPHKVVGMLQNKKDPRITDVSFEDGQVIRARYVIGADGARSVVRNMSGIGFSDPEGKTANHFVTQMVSGDVTFDREPAGVQAIEGYLNITASSSGFFFMVPFGTGFNAELTRDGKIPTKPIFRVGCVVPIEKGEPPHAPPKEYIQNLVDTYGPVCTSSDSSINPIPVKIDRVLWSTRFRTHSAIADHTFTRRFGAAVLLIGDAAHIHSPAGGQGMNLGIRDGIFLGEVVAKHIQASVENPDVDDTILEKFAEARHARALEIIGYTKKLLKVASLKYDGYAWWMPFSLASIRDVVLRFLGKFEFVQSRIAWGLSGLGRC